MQISTECLERVPLSPVKETFSSGLSFHLILKVNYLYQKKRQNRNSQILLPAHSNFVTLTNIAFLHSSLYLPSGILETIQGAMAVDTVSF